MGIMERIGTGIYNAGVRKRNEFVRGDLHVKDKAQKVGGYVHAVGTNIVNDVSTGQSQMFPFQMPKNSSFSGQQRSRSNRKKRRKQRQPYNPYSFI